MSYATKTTDHSTNGEKTQLINLSLWKEYINNLIILILFVIWLSSLAWLTLLIGLGLNDLLKQEDLLNFIRDTNFLELAWKAGWENLICLAVFLLLSAFLVKVIRQQLKRNFTNFFLYIVFVGLLFGIALITWYSLPEQQQEITIASVLQRITIILPLVWLASHVNALINSRPKAYVEYEHKEMVITFYSAFKDEIGYPDLKKAFTKGVIDELLRFPRFIGETRETDSPLDKILGRNRKSKAKKSIDKALEE